MYIITPKNEYQKMSSIIHFFVGFIASALPISLIYCCCHGVPSVTSDMILSVTGMFVLSVPIHELIHGMTCAYVSENNCKTISYGINWKGLNAFCRYTLPIEPGMRQIVIIMPCIVLAVIPALSGLITGDAALCLFAIYEFAGASKDIHHFYSGIRTNRR